MSTTEAEVLVVGAGPAGAAAALDLARAGVSVLMLDRPAQARAKPCAGGVTIKAAQRLRFAIAPVVRESVSAITMSHRGRWVDRFEAAAPVCLMTHRPELDAFCLTQARQAGAALEHIPGIARVTQDGLHTADGAGRVTLIASDGQAFRGRWLIAADGAHSPVRRLLLGQPDGATAMAIEGLLPREALTDVAWPGMRFDYASQAGGYGWLFPKGDHVNVGLYTHCGATHGISRERLLAYSRARLGSDALEAVKGYPIPVRGDQQPLSAGRVLFAGDAAGLAEALLGEGIYGAVFSGQMAAAAILGAGDVAASYQRNLQSWRRELAVVRRLARVYYRLLPVPYALLRMGLHKPLMTGFAEGLTLVQSKRRWLTRQ
ncbi:geranylgeranyl reductase family protein [Alcanivorax limicola]|uniref:geranylgeranyl reductase family protein n=1 Tax=Alcanivorax limicola TaxID=2874102 RepID=UPI001CBCB616|nr:geranylgeranyl reductase family protein [Alcanivorax limicola]